MTGQSTLHRLRPSDKQETLNYIDRYRNSSVKVDEKRKFELLHVFMSKFAEKKWNEIKRNERSCDMSIMGIWVKNEWIITGH